MKTIIDRIKEFIEYNNISIRQEGELCHEVEELRKKAVTKIVTQIN